MFSCWHFQIILFFPSLFPGSFFPFQWRSNFKSKSGTWCWFQAVCELYIVLLDYLTAAWNVLWCICTGRLSRLCDVTAVLEESHLTDGACEGGSVNRLQSLGPGSGAGLIPNLQTRDMLLPLLAYMNVFPQDGVRTGLPCSFYNFAIYCLVEKDGEILQLKFTLIFQERSWKLDSLCLVLVQWVEPFHKNHKRQQTLILINARQAHGSTLLWINNSLWHKGILSCVGCSHHLFWLDCTYAE